MRLLLLAWGPAVERRGVGRCPLLLVAACLLLLASCKPKFGDVAKPYLYTGPLVETRDALTLFSDSARLKFKLTAPLEQKYENGDIWYRRGVTVTFYNQQGQPQNTLRGRVGRYDKQHNQYHVRGNVQVQSLVKQEKLDTEELYFDQLKQRIYTDKFVRIETASEVLTGTGLTAAQDFSRYTILHPAGIFALKEAPQ